MTKLPPALRFLLRLLVTLGAALLAFSQVELGHVLPLLSAIPLPILLAALVLLHLTQLMGALRTRFYLAFHDITLSVKETLKLHYTGELFSAFLPGGAGGDVYKAWWLKRHHQGGLLNMIKLMIGNRLNGLWALGILVCLLMAQSPLRGLHPAGGMIILAAMIGGTMGYYLIARFALDETLRHQSIAALYSFALQATLVAMVWCLCIGLGLEDHAREYVMLFMLSCILVLLPISIGGIGVRELTVLHGSRLLHLSEDSGVALAVAFTVLNLSVPLVGACIHLFNSQKMPKDQIASEHI